MLGGYITHMYEAPLPEITVRDFVIGIVVVSILCLVLWFLFY